MSELRIAEIICEGRHRTDQGDLRALADSIDTIGLIHPVVVTPECKLVAGGRRLAAAMALGWDTIPVTIIHTLADATDALMAERDENTCRKDFTPTEAAAMRAAVAEAIKPLADERKATAIKERDEKGRAVSTGGNLPPVARTRDVAAQGTGYSGKTLDKVDKTKALAEDESQPEPIREVAREALAEMDRTGNVDKPFKKAQGIKAELDRAATGLDDALDSEVTIQMAKFRHNFFKVEGQFVEVTTFDAEQVAKVLETEEWDDIESRINSVLRWWDSVKSHRVTPGALKVVGGR
jgi:ParB family chromosome partitioning protein